MDKERIGIMGGTLDPVHDGHLRMARCALSQARLSRVLMLPSGNPPHKPHITPAEDRWRMLVAACAGAFALREGSLEHAFRLVQIDAVAVHFEETLFAAHDEEKAILIHLEIPVLLQKAYGPADTGAGVIQRLSHIGYIKCSFFLTYFGIKKYMEEYVAKFFAYIGVVLVEQSLTKLICFFDCIRAQ